MLCALHVITGHLDVPFSSIAASLSKFKNMFTYHMYAEFIPLKGVLIKSTLLLRVLFNFVTPGPLRKILIIQVTLQKD